MVKWFAAIVSLVELALTFVIFLQYDTSDGAAHYQLVDKATNWIPVESFRVQYFLAIDGLSAPLVLLTGLLGMVAIFASWSISHRVREYFVWLLALQGAVMGVFTALDFFLFFLFWELELIPMFFLISIWGTGRREYSAMKFLIFTILGSAFMLVGILALFFSTGTFDMTELPAAIGESKLLLPAIGDFRHALRRVRGEAARLASAYLAARRSYRRANGGERHACGSASEDGRVWDAARVRRDVPGRAQRRVLAIGGNGCGEYPLRSVRSVATDGYEEADRVQFDQPHGIRAPWTVVRGRRGRPGVAAWTDGSRSLQMFTHGAITGLLFLLVGYVYERAHTRHIPDLGGLAVNMPVLSASLAVAGLASLGLPATAGFVSEIHVFLGTFPVWGWLTALGAFGVVLTAGYILWMLQRVMFGPRNSRLDDLTDATPLEMVPVAALVIAIMVVGIFPSTIADVFSTGVAPIIDSLQNAVTSVQ